MMNYRFSLLIATCLSPLMVKSECGVNDVEITRENRGGLRVSIGEVLTGVTELTQAVMEGRVGDIARLINKGCDVNDQEMGRQESWTEQALTPLMIAVLNKNTPMVKELLKAPGIDLNLRSSKGRTAIYQAGYIGAVEAIKLLAEAGADMNLEDEEGFTPMFAPYKSLFERQRELAFETFKAFANEGVDLDVKVDQDVWKDYGMTGSTPLIILTWIGLYDTVEFLLCRGVDANVKNDQGLTALDLARRGEGLQGETVPEEVLRILENPPAPSSPQCQQHN